MKILVSARRALWGVAVLAAGACGEPIEPTNNVDASVEVDASATTFDPRGDEVSLYGDWNVNGEAPTAMGCKEAGLDTIELVFVEPSSQQEYTDESFRFACTRDFYETTPAKVLSAGDYQYQWRAYAGEDLVLQSQRYELHAEVSTEFELHRVDFVRRAPVSVRLAFTWANADGAPATCEAAAVSAGYTYALYRGSSTVTGIPVSGYDSNGTVACADTLTFVDFPKGTLTAGTYVLDVSGFSTSGVLWKGACIIQIPFGGSVDVQCPIARD